jgi:hypothetical protein
MKDRFIIFVLLHYLLLCIFCSNKILVLNFDIFPCILPLVSNLKKKIIELFFVPLFLNNNNNSDINFVIYNNKLFDFDFFFLYYSNLKLDLILTLELANSDAINKIENNFKIIINDANVINIIDKNTVYEDSFKLKLFLYNVFALIDFERIHDNASCLYSSLCSVFSVRRQKELIEKYSVFKFLLPFFSSFLSSLSYFVSDFFVGVQYLPSFPKYHSLCSFSYTPSSQSTSILSSFSLEFSSFNHHHHSSSINPSTFSSFLSPVCGKDITSIYSSFPFSSFITPTYKVIKTFLASGSNLIIYNSNGVKELINSGV